MRRLLPVLTALCLLAGCGGGGAENGDARQALTNLKPISSGVAAFTVRIDVKNPPPEVRGPIQLSVAGPIRSNGKDRVPSLDWRIAFVGFGQRFASRLVSTGTNVYIRLGGEDFELGEQAVARTNQDLAGSARTAPSGLASLGIDPLGAVADVKRVGKSTTAGTPTTRYAGRIDLDRLLDQIGRFLQRVPQVQQAIGGRAVPQKALTPRQRAQVKETFRDPRFEADVASDRTLRALRIAIPFVTPPARQKAAAGITGGTIAYRLTYSRVGAAQVITPPRRAAPLKDFVRALNRILGRPA